MPLSCSRFENDYRKAMTERERVASRLRTLGVAETQLKEIVGIVAQDDVLMLLGREMYQVAAGRGNVSRCVNEEKAV